MSDSENERKSAPMMLLLAVLTILGVRSFTPDSAGPSGEHPKAKDEHRAGEKRDENTEAANGVDRFWQPLKEFQDAKVEGKLAADIKKLSDDLRDIGGWDTRYLIACVPDPIESSSGYRFDGLIDAIQRATETQGYVEDRYFYPWTKRKGGGKGLSSEQGDTSKQSEWHRQPGVLLLRDSSNSRLLVVFLVGETATAGIHKEAFAACLQLIGKSEEYQRTHTVHVLGPYFSGSQVSLERTIRAWGEHEKKAEEPILTFRVISGNAMGIDKKRLEHCCTRARVSFHATVAPERDVFAALVEHLNLGSRQDGHFSFKDKFAILHESNTTFGQMTVLALKQHRNAADSAAQEPTLFPFPLHISEVRDAYSKTASGTKGDTLRLPSFGSKLDLPAENDNHSKDVEPSLNGPTTAVISERLLTQMLQTISHERFRYVFILATDVQDKLFLAHLVRQQCPDCRLVFTDSDLLFGHPDFSGDLRGSIVGSTYPLHARNQRWSFPFQGNKARFFFPGPGEQGCYNAVIALLNPERSDTLFEYGPPFPDLYPVDSKRSGCATADADELAQAPVDPRRPAIWISIIGEGGLYPLKAIPARIAHEGDCAKEIDSYDGYVFRAPLHPEHDWPPLHPEHDRQPKAEFVPAHSSLLIATVLGMVLLLGYLSWSYFSAADWPSGRARKHGTAMQELFRPRSPQLRRRQKVYTFVCLTSVLVVSGYLAFVCLLPFGHWLLGANSPVRIDWCDWLTPAILGTLLAFVLWRAWLGFRGAIVRFLHRYRAYLLYAALLLAILAAYLFLSGRYPLKIGLSGESLLFAERAGSLASGVSPTVPILLIGLAFFFWSYAHLKRLYLLDVHAVKNPFPPLFEQVDRWHGEAVGHLWRPERALVKKGTLVVWSIFFFAFWLLSSRFVPAADGATAERLILLALAVLAVAIVSSWLQLRKTWETTRHLLNALALLPQPLQEAFERIPTVITRMFGPYLSSQRPGRQEHLSYRLEQRRLLLEEHARIAHTLNAVVPLAVVEQEKTAADPHPDKEKPIGPDMLTDSARACLIVLQHVWRDTDLQASADANPTIRLWLTRATDFAALETMAYLGQFFVHLRNLAVFLSLAPLLMLLAATSYPFQPQRLWLFLSVALIGLVTTSVISIVIQIERNELVSRILKTTPNQLNFHWGFLSHLVLYVVPLLGVLAAMSGEVSNLVHSWVDPLLQMMK